MTASSGFGETFMAYALGISLALAMALFSAKAEIVHTLSSAFTIDSLAEVAPPRNARLTGPAIAIGLLLAIGVGASPARAAPLDIRIAVVDGRNVAYRVLGSGQPVIVMISGLGDGMQSFKDVAPELAKTATVIVYDRAGYGSSTVASAPADAMAAARDLEGVLKQSGVQGPYILVGHSLGGLYAEYYAATHPNDVAGLVLEESRPADFSTRCEAAQISMCTPTSAMMMTSPRGARDEAASLAATSEQVEGSGRAKGIPVLVISRPFGSRPSPFEALWIQTQEDLAGRYVGSTHLIAPEGGHYVHRQARAWFISALRQFYGTMGHAR